MTINYEVLEVEKYKHHTGPESDHNTMGIKSLKLPCATLFFSGYIFWLRTLGSLYDDFVISFFMQRIER